MMGLDFVRHGCGVFCGGDPVIGNAEDRLGSNVFLVGVSAKTFEC